MTDTHSTDLIGKRALVSCKKGIRQVSGNATKRSNLSKGHKAQVR
jgi:hypothetical protein